MPESNWGSRWWRNWSGKKRDSSCKISNEIVAGIEILFKEKDIKYLEFLFVYCMDDAPPPPNKYPTKGQVNRTFSRQRRQILNRTFSRLKIKSSSARERSYCRR
ncbi:protein ycf2 [Phtheirospermum japonicum]|uniref:Protein ycf2 n=1 Tax=Phtheirospermum japonicum TaxID=374723 RepID=A0A830CIF1_9LAMI|nr:protein ycf2 [Phtheirospermum japonicum]